MAGGRLGSDFSYGESNRLHESRAPISSSRGPVEVERKSINAQARGDRLGDGVGGSGGSGGSGRPIGRLKVGARAASSRVGRASFGARHERAKAQRRGSNHLTAE